MSANILHKVITTQGLFYKITARTMGVVRTGFEETSHHPNEQYAAQTILKNWNRRMKELSNERNKE